TPQNSPPFPLVFLRKGHRKIPHADLPQPKMQQIHELSDTNGKRARKRSRQNAHHLQKSPSCRVFQSPPHQGSLTLSRNPVMIPIQQSSRLAKKQGVPHVSPLLRDVEFRLSAMVAAQE